MTTINLDIVLKRLINQDITLRKWTETQEDDLAGTITRVATDYTIRGAVYNNPLEYTYWATMGGLQVGEARGFFFKEYEIDTGEPPHAVAEPEDLVSVAEGDYIVDVNDYEYEVTRISHHTDWGYTVVVATLQRRTA